MFATANRHIKRAIKPCKAIVPWRDHALFAVSLSYSGSSIQRSISDATIRRLGRWGIMVPAMTLNPSDNIALAYCLASISVGNDFDCLGEGARDKLGGFWPGLSIETYQ
jgi:hypothetical protein